MVQQTFFALLLGDSKFETRVQDLLSGWAGWHLPCQSEYQQPIMGVYELLYVEQAR